MTVLEPHCRQCGDTKPLGPAGICRWRAGCEHRQFVHEATMARLNRQLEHAGAAFPAGLIASVVDDRPFIISASPARPIRTDAFQAALDRQFLDLTEEYLHLLYGEPDDG